MPRSQWGRHEIGEPSTKVKKVRARGAALLGAVLLLGACEGDTLYDVPTEPGAPGPIQPGTGRGELVNIPGLGAIADMAVDPMTQRVFLSNTGDHRIEVLDLEGLQFQSNGVRVGSQPWGISLNRTGDTLIVANSGGTNVSFVPTTTLQENVTQRFELPRVTLYDYQEAIDTTEAGDVTVTITLDFQNYADRPQYVVQDYRGRLLYSAISTAAMPTGTMRLAEWKPGWQTWDARLLFPCCLLVTNQAPSNRAVRAVHPDSAALAVAIANVDSISQEYAHSPPFAGITGNVIIWDHVPGSLPGAPNRIIRTPPLPMLAAIRNIYNQGSDIIVYGGAWNLPESTTMADTTFVAVSEDRRWVAFGEMPASQAGRMIMWSAADSTLSRVEDIQDIVNNSSDRMLGVSLNNNGTLGVARGTLGS
jgi:hypothetical protein